MDKALALVTAKQSAWTRHDLLKQLVLVMPTQVRQMNPQAARELLFGLAEEAISARAGDIVCLEAPEWPPLPRSLRRDLDGRSIYTRPGTARYATAASSRPKSSLIMADEGSMVSMAHLSALTTIYLAPCSWRPVTGT